MMPNQVTRQRVSDAHMKPGPTADMMNHTAKPDQYPPWSLTPDQPGDQFADRKRRHKIIDDRPLHLADQQREAGDWRSCSGSLP
jgi:hypothetical protein